VKNLQLSQITDADDVL